MSINEEAVAVVQNGSVPMERRQAVQIVHNLSADGLLAPTPQIIRTVEELEALDPYDVIAYKSPEGYGLVCTAYDATIGDTDYTLPVATVCSNNTTMPALRALNQEEA